MGEIEKDGGPVGLGYIVTSLVSKSRCYINCGRDKDCVTQMLLSNIQGQFCAYKSMMHIDLDS